MNQDLLKILQQYLLPKRALCIYAGFWANMKIRMVKNPTYNGMTPQFWNSCDRICGPGEWMLWGIPNCGKGQPMQTAEVSHGAAPARFKKVSVGV